MHIFRQVRFYIAFPLAVFMAVLSAPLGVASAALVSTDSAIETVAADDARERVIAFMAREDVRQQLQAAGVAPDEASMRVAGLSDAEVQQIAARIDELPAGQSAVGSIVGALVLIFLVLLVTDLLGYTNVFPFIKKTVR